MARDGWDRYGGAVRRECRARLHIAGRVLVNAIRIKISQGYPPASQPGEPPHVRTGELRRSYTTRQEETREGLVQIVGTNKEYAPALEYGEASINLEARPHVRPAVEQTRAAIRAVLSQPLPPNLV